MIQPLRGCAAGLDPGLMTAYLAFVCAPGPAGSSRIWSFVTTMYLFLKLARNSSVTRYHSSPTQTAPPLLAGGSISRPCSCRKLPISDWNGLEDTGSPLVGCSFMSVFLPRYELRAETGLFSNCFLGLCGVKCTESVRSDG